MGVFRRIDNGTTTVRDGQIVRYLIITAFLVGIIITIIVMRG